MKVQEKSFFPRAPVVPSEVGWGWGGCLGSKYLLRRYDWGPRALVDP